MKTCTVTGCKLPIYGKGFCKKHHQWHWKRGILPPDKTIEERFWDNTKVCDDDQCWEWMAGKHVKGYGEFKRSGYGRAHRYSYAAFRGELKKGDFVLHKCNNPKCVNPAHLYAGTHQDNMEDMALSGIQHGNRSRLTAGDARSILRLRISGVMIKEITKTTGFTKTEILGITSCGNFSWDSEVAELLGKYRSLPRKSLKGSEIKASKITDTEAMQIFLSTDKYSVIATEFGISKTLVGNIKRKTAWKHIHHKSVSAIPGILNRHATPEEFKARYGSDDELYDLTRRLLGETE